jgi:NTP pyrophosphatase (non-canonical NTP hydrolase)
MKRTEDIEFYHGSALMSKATEECGELVQAISKYANKGGRRNENKILEEAADAMVMITALIKYLEADEDKFFKRIEKSKKKFDRYYEEDYSE